MATCPQEALEEIAWPEDVPWDEGQAVTAEDPTVVQDVDDDLGRELAFYNQVLRHADCVSEFNAM